jgi:hypothetical protein
LRAYRIKRAPFPAVATVVAAQRTAPDAGVSFRIRGTVINQINDAAKIID